MEVGNAVVILYVASLLIFNCNHGLVCGGFRGSGFIFVHEIVGVILGNIGVVVSVIVICIGDVDTVVIVIVIIINLIIIVFFILFIDGLIFIRIAVAVVIIDNEVR